MKRKLYWIVLFLLGAIFIFSIIQIGRTLYDYHHAGQIYSGLQAQYVQRAAPEADIGEQVETVSAPIQVDFRALMQENDDIVGWLYCADTPINYPVVQSADNNDYLRRDLQGNYLASGTLFVDFRCQAIDVTQNYIIHGHNMKDTTMFGTLINYGEQAYYDQHPVLYFLTPEKDYFIELFAGYVIESVSEVYTPEFDDAQTFGAFLQQVRAKSSFTSDVTVTETDHIVTLSTCSYAFNNARYVVLGKVTELPAANRT